MARLNHARDVLMDDKKRRVYDMSFKKKRWSRQRRRKTWNKSPVSEADLQAAKVRFCNAKLEMETAEQNMKEAARRVQLAENQLRTVQQARDEWQHNRSTQGKTSSAKDTPSQSPRSKFNNASPSAHYSQPPRPNAEPSANAGGRNSWSTGTQVPSNPTPTMPNMSNMPNVQTPPVFWGQAQPTPTTQPFGNAGSNNPHLQGMPLGSKPFIPSNMFNQDTPWTNLSFQTPSSGFEPPAYNDSSEEEL